MSLAQNSDVSCTASSSDMIRLSVSYDEDLINQALFMISIFIFMLTSPLQKNLIHVNKTIISLCIIDLWYAAVPYYLFSAFAVCKYCKFTFADLSVSSSRTPSRRCKKSVFSPWKRSSLAPDLYKIVLQRRCLWTKSFIILLGQAPVPTWN